jgi:hypothetical protein
MVPWAVEAWSYHDSPLQMCCQSPPFASVLIQEESNWASPEMYFMFLPRGSTFECCALLISLDGAKR